MKMVSGPLTSTAVPRDDHENVGVCRCHFGTHSSALDLKIMFPVKLIVISFEYEGKNFDQSLCRWVLDFSFLPNFLTCLDAIFMRNIGIKGNEIHGVCRVEMGPGHLAFLGNMLCPLSRTAGFEHELADVNQQTLIFFREMAIGRNYGAARVAGFVCFGEEIESACFRLVNKQVIYSKTSHYENMPI